MAVLRLKHVLIEFKNFDGQKKKYSVLNECNRMLKYNIFNSSHTNSIHGRVRPKHVLIEFKKWMCYIDGQKNKYSGLKYWSTEVPGLYLKNRSEAAHVGRHVVTCWRSPGHVTRRVVMCSIQRQDYKARGRQSCPIAPANLWIVLNDWMDILIGLL
jgi:hypothetical protein